MVTAVDGPRETRLTCSTGPEGFEIDTTQRSRPSSTETLATIVPSTRGSATTRKPKRPSSSWTLAISDRPSIVEPETERETTRSPSTSWAGTARPDACARDASNRAAIPTHLSHAAPTSAGAGQRLKSGAPAGCVNGARVLIEQCLPGSGLVVHSAEPHEGQRAGTQHLFPQGPVAAGEVGLELLQGRRRVPPVEQHAPQSRVRLLGLERAGPGGENLAVPGHGERAITCEAGLVGGSEELGD